jgi:hypothetical protein
MSRLFLGRGAVLLAAAVACARPAPDRSAAESSSGAVGTDSVVVALERGPCLGTCPVYRVTIARSGAVRFEGRRFVRDSGRVMGAISRAAVDSLLAELEAGGYFELADRYVPGEPGCGAAATDLPTVITEVTWPGRTKRIEHYHGCADRPAALSALERRIDDVAGTDRWTGRSSSP